MTVGDLPRAAIPETLVLMTHQGVVDARRKGQALIAFAQGLERLIWVNAAAAAMFGLRSGPQFGDEAALCAQVESGLGAGRAGSLELASGEIIDVSAQTVTLSEPERECVLVTCGDGDAGAQDYEPDTWLAEIGDQPVALWRSDRAWFDAGFGETSQVYLEDLYDLKDGRPVFDLAFLPDGRPIGMAKLSRRMIAVWHYRAGEVLRFDMEASAVRAGEGDGPADERLSLTEPEPEPETNRADADGGGDSFAKEIESLKSLGGSLLTAAGAALGGAVLDRLGKSRDNRAESSGEVEGDSRSEIEARHNVEVESNIGGDDIVASADENGDEPGPVEADEPLQLEPANANGSNAGPLRPRLRSNWGASGGMTQDEDHRGAELVENADLAAGDGVSGEDEQGTAAAHTALSPGEDRRDAPHEIAAEADLPTGSDEEPSGFQADLASAPVRFIWRLDQDGCFQTLSPEFAATVGPKAADVLDLSFADLADGFILDPDGEIVSLITRRDTWSDRTVLWPVEGTDQRVPVDLAALPIYSRDRSFDGLRGFGVVRPMDAEPDPNAWGERLAAGATARQIVEETIAQQAREAGIPEMEDDLDPLDEGTDADWADVTPTGRDPYGAAGGDVRASSVVELSERRARREQPLSAEEAAAFRTIGVALTSREGTENLEDAIQQAKQKIAAFGNEAGLSSDEGAGAASAGEAGRSELGEPAKGDRDARIVSELSTFYGRLPVPILVQSGNLTVFANEEFADLTGYRNAEALMAAGGLDQLFDDGPHGESVRLRRAAGKTIDVRARMQRIMLRGQSFLMMSFFASPRLTVTDLSEQKETPPPLLEDAATLQSRLQSVMANLGSTQEAILVLDEEGCVEAANERARVLFADARNGSYDESNAAAPNGVNFTALFAGDSAVSAIELLFASTERDFGTAEISAEGISAGQRDGPGSVDVTVDGPDGEPIALTLVAEPLDAGGWCVIMRETETGEGTRPETGRIRGDAAVSDQSASPSVGLTTPGEAEPASLPNTELLATVAHEIRTPMTAILGFADAIESEAFGPIGNPRYLDYIADIKRSGRHVLDLVTDLLDLSRAEAGRLDLDFTAVALNQVGSEVAAMMQPVAGGARIVLRSNLPPSVPPVIADERSVRQIVTNLLQNAVSFTPPGGQVILSTQYREDGGVTLKCRDNGVGMTEDELAAALKPFHRVKRDKAHSSTGFGMGLPLASALAEANGADLVFKSVPQNGTLVELRFPPDRVIAD